MEKYSLGRKNGRETQLDFEGEDVSSDGGLILIDEIEKQTGILENFSECITDHRDESHLTHSAKNIISQRVYAIIAGHEDLNDHQHIKEDPFYQALLNKSTSLASPSTLCRYEKGFELSNNIEAQKIFVENFINAYKEPPISIVLDFDPTDATLYGDQENKKFNGHYGDYCYLPLIVTSGQHLLAAYLRPSNIDGAKHVWAILALLVRRIRDSWPDVEITFRADSGLCRHRIFNWCEKKNVKYIVGVPGNAVLKKDSESLRNEVEEAYNSSNNIEKRYDEFSYKAATWKIERRVIFKAEFNHHGSNTRYIVTNLEGQSEQLYCDVYCQRGDMENRIKEIQLDLFGKRMSASKYAGNQLRLLLAGVAYIFMTILNTHVATANNPKMYCSTIRKKIIKAAVIIKVNTRKIYLSISRNFPYQNLFISAMRSMKMTA